MVHPCWCHRYTQCLCLNVSPKRKTHAGSNEFFFQLQTNNKVVCIEVMCEWDVDKYNCMMGHCDNCPDLSVLKSFLRNELLKIIDPDETIQFSQWVSTDRNQLVKKESKFDDFIRNLVGKFGKLAKHHDVAEKQAEFFKQLKENLQFGECVIVLAFAENLFFLVQVAAQGFHVIIHRQQYTHL